MIAELIVRKNRNGPIDTVQLAFIEKYASFRTLARSDFDAPAADLEAYVFVSKVPDVAVVAAAAVAAGAEKAKKPAAKRARKS